MNNFSALLRKSWAVLGILISTGLWLGLFLTLFLGYFIGVAIILFSLGLIFFLNFINQRKKAFIKKSK